MTQQKFMEQSVLNHSTHITHKTQTYVDQGKVKGHALGQETDL